VNNMIEYFARRGIESVNFLESSRDALPDNILKFTRLFNDAIRYDNPHQWLEQKLREEGCSWVQIFQQQDDDEKDYGENLEDKRYEKAQKILF